MKQVYLYESMLAFVAELGEQNKKVYPGPGLFPLVDNFSDNYGDTIIIERTDGMGLAIHEPNPYKLFIFDDEKQTLDEAKAAHEHWVQHEKALIYGGMYMAHTHTELCEEHDEPCARHMTGSDTTECTCPDEDGPKPDDIYVVIHIEKDGFISHVELLSERPRWTRGAFLRATDVGAAEHVRLAHLNGGDSEFVRNWRHMPGE